MRAAGEHLREVTVASPDEADTRVFEVGLSRLTDRAGAESGSIFTTGAESGSIFTIRDVSDRVHLYQQVRRLSMLDDLTAVANRRSFLEAGARELDLCPRGDPFGGHPGSHRW